MEQQQAQQVEQQLRQDWQQIRYRILDQFAQVSTSDLDSARNVNDLVQRIADRSHHSERYVETRLLELVGTGTGQLGGQTGQTGSPGQAGRPFGSSQGQQGRAFGAAGPTGQQTTGQ
jgi:hypothetical protein